MHKDLHTELGCRQSGFSLIELIVTLSVTLILVFIGIPSFSKMLIRGEITSASLALRTGLSVARSEAVKRGAHIQICSLDTVISQCAGKVGSGRLVWDYGFMVFQDVNSDNAYTAGTDELLHTSLFNESLIIDWGRGHYLVYAPSGRLQMGNSSFHIKHPADALERHLILNNVGRVRSMDI